MRNKFLDGVKLKLGPGRKPLYDNGLYDVINEVKLVADHDVGIQYRLGVIIEWKGFVNEDIRDNQEALDHLKEVFIRRLAHEVYGDMVPMITELYKDVMERNHDSAVDKVRGLLRYMS